MENETKILDPEINAKESSLLRQNIAGIIDGASIITLFVILTYNLPQIILDKLQNPIPPEIYILILFGFYRLVALLLANGTLGMWLCRIKFLNSDYERLSIKEKLCAAFFVLINGVGYYNR
jgi:uncharacterized RDD family membrane protein YckC